MTVGSIPCCHHHPAVLLVFSLVFVFSFTIPRRNSYVYSFHAIGCPNKEWLTLQIWEPSHLDFVRQYIDNWYYCGGSWGMK